MYRLGKETIQAISEFVFLEDPPEAADVIFLPGCDRPEHARRAAALYREGYAPLIVPSGAFPKAVGSFQGPAATGRDYGSGFLCEADFLEAVLLSCGVPKNAILKETEATFTLENAQKTRRLLEEHGLTIRTAILCCKAHHARRAFLYYSMVFPEVRIRICPAPVDGITRDTWIRSPAGRRAVLGEVSRMGEQILMMEDRIDYGGPSG